jgi:SAM-dependent methyltransferase
MATAPADAALDWHQGRHDGARAKGEVAEAGTAVQRWICADAMALTTHLKEPVDFVFLANTFHGVPDQTGLVCLVRTVLRPHGALALINWYPADRDETPVLGQARGPKLEQRLSPPAVAAIVAAAGFQLARLIELPPYHYAAVFTALP